MWDGCTDDGGVEIVVDGVDVTADAEQPRSDGDDAIEHICWDVATLFEDTDDEEDGEEDGPPVAAAAATKFDCDVLVSILLCCCWCSSNNVIDTADTVDTAATATVDVVCATLNSLERLGTLP